MDKQQKEALMDELLVFMNEEVEESGCTINILRFDFTEQGEDAIAFVEKSKISYEQFVLVMNTSLARRYITHSYCTNEKKGLVLTEEGQGRAISVEAAKHAKPMPQQAGNIHIGTLNAHGPTQVGNYNTQTIENVFTAIIEKIDRSDAPEAEKQEAKSRLKAFLEHPLTNTAIGLTPSIVQAICGGG